MNSIIAASLFENPWVIVVIVLVSVISNWLMKRRQAEGLASPTESESPPAPDLQKRPARQPDFQDILRQLLGGEPLPAATPPPIPHAARDEQTFPAEGDEEELHFDRQAKHPVRAMGAAQRRYSSAGGRAVRLWRDPRIVRRAFVASLIFAPPKGLEP